MSRKAPIAISYRPKEQDYLPVVVAAIRHHLGDWPVVLLTEAQDLPPEAWLKRNRVEAITRWEHSPDANKILRLWEHQAIFARHFDRWIWWHDDMLLLHPVKDPVAEFSRPRVRHGPRQRPNRKLSNWQGWLWDTLGFFACQSIDAPNPVLHVPRLVERAALEGIPEHWNRERLLFEPTYLLWHWHQLGLQPTVEDSYRIGIFKGELPELQALEQGGHSILTWGRKIDHTSAREVFGARYPLDFN